MTERKLLALTLAVVISTAAVAGVGTNALLSDSESVPVAFSGNVSGNVDTGQLQSAGNEGPIIQNDTEENGTVTQSNETETQTNEMETQTNEMETQTNETETQTNETVTQTNETVTQTNETETQSNETETQTNETETQTNETETQTNETETQSNETESTDTINKSEELSSTDVAAPGTTADTMADHQRRTMKRPLAGKS